MKVIIDTSVWSLALRRKEEKLNEKELGLLKELMELIREARAVIIGPIRQEVLSGISHKEQYNILKEKLSNFDDIEISTSDYEYAAELFNLCRSKGIQGSHIDFIICAISINNNYSIYTIDEDFKYYKKYCKIKLHSIRSSK